MGKTSCNAKTPHRVIFTLKHVSITHFESNGNSSILRECNGVQLRRVKWRHLYGKLIRGVVPIFSQRKPATPLFLLRTRIAAQIHLQTTIKDFGLSIHLWLIRRAHSQVRPLKAKVLDPKLTGKYGVAV